MRPPPPGVCDSLPWSAQWHVQRTFYVLWMRTAHWLSLFSMGEGLRVVFLVVAWALPPTTLVAILCVTRYLCFQLRMVKKPAKQVHRVFSCVVALTGWRASEGAGHTGGTPPATARTTRLPSLVTWSEIREMLAR